jgi:hypothetical protein
MPGRKYQLDITGPCHGGTLNSTLPGRYHGDNISSASPDLCRGIRISSTSPGLATVITPCTSGVLRLPLASPWRRFPTRAGRFQGCTFGDSAPLRSLAIVLAWVLGDSAPLRSLAIVLAWVLGDIGWPIDCGLFGVSRLRVVLAWCSPRVSPPQLWE